MKTFRRVQLHGRAGFTDVEDGATRGATLGATLFLADGTVLTLQGLADALGTLPAATPNPAPGGVIRTPSVTVWGLIQQIPANIQALAALTGEGLAFRALDGSWSLRFLQVPPIEFSYGDAAGVIWTPAVAGTLTVVRIVFTTPFDGAGAALTIGTVADADAALPSDANSPGDGGEFELTCDVPLAADESVTITITPGTGATQGAGVVYLSFVPD